MNRKLNAPFSRQIFDTKMLNPHSKTLHCIVEECVLRSPKGDRELLVLLRRVVDGSRADYGSIQLYKKGGGRYLDECMAPTRWFGDLTAEECQSYVDRKVKEWKIEEPSKDLESELDQFIG